MIKNPHKSLFENGITVLTDKLITFNAFTLLYRRVNALILEHLKTGHKLKGFGSAYDTINKTMVHTWTLTAAL
ncbi:MAG: hypothetical protein H0X02_08650 [Nitrosomonas sp.]|nr:hypothetical protein [Nitrosomonas sp.]